MANVEYVSTREQLKAVLEAEKVDYIAITDKELANKVETVNTASTWAIGAVVAGGAAAAALWWNPLGWVGGAAALGAGATLTTAIVWLIAAGLTIALVKTLSEKYEIAAKGEITLPGGTKIKGELILKSKNEQ